jgi:hypothetical protein
MVMFQGAAKRPVAIAIRTMLPQTSAHWAQHGPRKECDVGQKSTAPASSAASSWNDQHSPASVYLHKKFAVECVEYPSRVECSWGYNSACDPRGDQGRCSRSTDEG